MVGAEADAELAQRRASVLRQRLHFRYDPRALENAERFRYLKRDASRDPFEPISRFEFFERAEQFLHVLGDPQIESPLYLFERSAVQRLVGEHANLRLQHVIAGRELADRFT